MSGEVRKGRVKQLSKVTWAGDKKRLISVLLSVALVIGMIPVMGITTGVHADETVVSITGKSYEKTIAGLGTATIGNPQDVTNNYDDEGVHHIIDGKSKTYKDLWKGTYVYYGKYNGEPLVFRVLDKSTTDFNLDTENAAGIKKMLLDCDSYIETMQFGSDNTWSGSNIKTWLNGEDFFESDGVFTPIEKGYILQSYKTEPKGTDGTGYNGGSFVNLNGEYIFLLDAKEATNSKYGYKNSVYDEIDYTNSTFTRAKGFIGEGLVYDAVEVSESGESLFKSYGWWLRSKESSGSGAIYVVPPTYEIKKISTKDKNGQDVVVSVLVIKDEEEQGLITPYYTIGTIAYETDLGVSPVFNIDPTSIMFTTEVTEPGSDSYGGVYKLTLKDESLTIALGADGVKREGNKITVDTDVTGTANRVSVLMIDGTWDSANNAWSDGASKKFYGKLDADNSFDLPEGYDIAWNTYILAEQENGKEETDYASVPVKISIPTGDKTIIGFGTGMIGNPKDATNASANDVWRGSYVYFGSFDTDDDGEPEPVLYRVLDPSTTAFNSSNENNNSIKKMLLDCDSILYYFAFDEDGYKNQSGYSHKVNEWDISDLKYSVNGDGFLNKLNVFTSIEKDAITSSVKSEATSEDGVGWKEGSTEYSKFVSINNEKIFALDAKEVTNPKYGYLNTSGQSYTRNKKTPANHTDPFDYFWWLRSPDKYDNDSSACVAIDDPWFYSGPDDYPAEFEKGFLYSTYATDNTTGVSPAFTINPAVVMFSTLVKKADADGYGAEYKLTLKDESLTVAIDTNTPITGCNDIITVAATKSDNANRVSVVMTDGRWDSDNKRWSEGAEVKYYDKADGDNDQLRFRIPENFDESWNIYLVAEIEKGAKMTDYAGNPVQITSIPHIMSATVTGYDGSYDGKDHGAIISVTAPDTGAIIKFKDTNGDFTLDASPSIKDVADSPLTVYYMITADGYTSKEGFVTVSIANAEQSAPDAPTKQSSSATSITLTATEGFEYRCNAGKWQTSNVFTNLEQNTEYTFYQRRAVKANYNPSPESRGAVIKTDDHSHSFSYSADGATITASCSGEGTCSITNGLTMTISAPAEETLVYDGKEKAAVLNKDYDTTAFPGEHTIKYYKGTEELTTVPVNAGTYKAEVTVDEKTAYVEYTIAKAEKAAPTGLKAFRESVYGRADGMITGLDNSMEYRSDNEKGYRAVTGNTLTGLRPGVYYVRFSETENYKASPDTSISIMSGTIVSENTSPEPIPDEPKVGDKEGWNEVSALIEQIPSGGSLTINMNGTTKLPKTVIEMMKDKDAEFVLDMGKGIKWKINGNDISDIKGDIDLGVSSGLSMIPAKIINNITGEKYCTSIHLNHSGVFGFKAVLEIELNEKNAGLYANLYYYNRNTGLLEFVSSAEINTDGSAELDFEHASDYIVVIDDHSLENPVIKAKVTKRNVKLTWDIVPNADSYTVYVAKDGKYVELKTTTKTSFTKKKLKNNTKYTFLVRANIGGNLTEVSDSYKKKVRVCYKPVLGASSEDGKITLSWTKVNNAKKYRIYKLVDNEWKYVKTTKKNTLLITKCSSGKKYKYAVRAYVNGAWTEIDKVSSVKITAT